MGITQCNIDVLLVITRVVVRVAIRHQGETQTPVLTRERPLPEPGHHEQAELAPVLLGGQLDHGLAQFFRQIWATGPAGVKVTLSVLQETQVREISVPTADRYRFLKVSRQR